MVSLKKSPSEATWKSGLLSAVTSVIVTVLASPLEIIWVNSSLAPVILMAVIPVTIATPAPWT